MLAGHSFPMCEWQLPQAEIEHNLCVIQESLL